MEKLFGRYGYVVGGETCCINCVTENLNNQTEMLYGEQYVCFRCGDAFVVPSKPHKERFEEPIPTRDAKIVRLSDIAASLSVIHSIPVKQAKLAILIDMGRSFHLIHAVKRNTLERMKAEDLHRSGVAAIFNDLCERSFIDSGYYVIDQD